MLYTDSCGLLIYLDIYINVILILCRYARVVPLIYIIADDCFSCLKQPSHNNNTALSRHPGTEKRFISRLLYVHLDFELLLVEECLKLYPWERETVHDFLCSYIARTQEQGFLWTFLVAT